MNKHVELVKKWISDPESVTQEELEACAAYAAAVAYDVAAAATAAAADAYATAAAAYADADAAAYWVKRYEYLTS
jgi:hypothetical protein